MGLFDSIASTVVTRYKADTSQHKAAIKSLRGEEKKLAKERLDSIEASNAKLTDQIAIVGKVTAAVAAAIAAWKVAREAVRAYAEDAQMHQANTKFSVEGLSKAAHGLISDYELLKLAAAASNTDFAITQQQLEGVVGGMLALRRQGNDLNTVMTETTKSIVEGTTEGMKKFGVVLDTTGTKAEQHARLLARLGEEGKKMAGNFAIAGDDFIKAENSFGDAVHQIKVSFGQLVDEAIGPLVGELAGVAREAGEAVKAITPLVAKMAEAAGLAARFGFNSTTAKIAFTNPFLIAADLLGSDKKATPDLLKDHKRTGPAPLGSPEVVEEYERLAAAGQRAGKVIREIKREVEREKAARRSRSGKSDTGPSVEVLFEDPEYRDIARSVLGIDLPGNIPGGRTSFGGRAGGLGLRGGIPQADEAAIALQAAQALSNAMDKVIYKGAGETSLMRAVFGPVEELDAYVVGLKAVTDAATAGFDAWVSGSKSVGEAVKMSIVASIAALGKEMFVRSLFHTAAGIGALATPGGQVAAAKHFESAAAYGAGAAIAGTTARLLGGSGGSPGASRAGTSGVGAVGPSTRSGGTSIFFLGDGFIESSPRQRAARTKKLLDRVGQSAGGDRSDVLEFD